MDLLSFPVLLAVVAIGAVSWAVVDWFKLFHKSWWRKARPLQEVLKHTLPILVAILLTIAIPQWLFVAVGIEVAATSTLSFLQGKVVIGLLSGVASSWSYSLLRSLFKTRTKRGD
jgi:H+/Cl- antiporter ClcA